MKKATAFEEVSPAEGPKDARLFWALMKRSSLGTHRLLVAVVIVASVMALLIGTLNVCAKEPLFAEGSSRPEREPEGGLQDSARVPLADESSGRERQEPSGAEDEVRFLGTIYVLHPLGRKLAVGVGRIQVAPKSEMRFDAAPDSDGGEWIPTVGVLAADESGNGVISYDAYERPFAPVIDGAWEMDIPKEGLVVTALEIEGLRTRIVSGGVISAGALRAVVEVELLGTGRVTVLDSLTLEGLDGIEVAEVRLHSQVAPETLRIESFTWTFGGPSVERSRYAARPPGSASQITTDARSPFEIPLVDFERELWVGKQGYQWAQLKWGGLRSEAVVHLHRVGGLEVRLANVESVPGRFDVQVSRDDELVGFWRSERTDRVLGLREIGEGEYRVILRHRVKRAGSVLHDTHHVVVPGETTVVELDVADLVGRQVNPGSLSIVIDAPTELSPSAVAKFRVLLSRLEGASLELPTFDQQLDSLSFDGESYQAGFPEIPAGTYSVGLGPCGLQQIVEVEPNKDVQVSLDLSGMAYVNVWPSALDRLEGHSWNPSTCQVRWRPVSMIGPERETKTYGSGQVSFPEVLVRAAPWKDGAWRVICPPGQVVVQAYDRAGRAISRPTRYDVLAGPNDQSLELSGSGGSQVRIEVTGLNASQYEVLQRQLISSFTDATGAVADVFVSRSSERPRLGALTVHFAYEGEYSLSLLPIDGLLPTAPVPERIAVKDRVLASMELSWE